MKKIFATIAAIIAMAITSMLFTSCNKDADSIDYYGFSQSFKLDESCDFSALSPVYAKYKDMTLYCKDTPKSEAQRIWNEAQAAFKSVENQMTAPSGCYIKVTMSRYSPVNDTYTPIETIGSWSFPASN